MLAGQAFGQTQTWVFLGLVSWGLVLLGIACVSFQWVPHKPGPKRGSPFLLESLVSGLSAIVLRVDPRWLHCPNRWYAGDDCESVPAKVTLKTSVHELLYKIRGVCAFNDMLIFRRPVPSGSAGVQTRQSKRFQSSGTLQTSPRGFGFTSLIIQAVSTIEDIPHYWALNIIFVMNKSSGSRKEPCEFWHAYPL